MKFKELNDDQFAKAKRDTLRVAPSSFFDFTNSLRGYDLYLGEKQVFKWEVHDVYSAEDILNQKTPIIYKPNNRFNR